MPRKPKAPLSQLDLLEARTSTAPCVPQIREAVAKWKEGGIKSGYKGISNTTRILLNHWFYTDHKSRFKYHGFQQEAIETLIYLYELEMPYALRSEYPNRQWRDFHWPAEREKSMEETGANKRSSQCPAAFHDLV